MNLNETDLVLDHAIYPKAVEIVMNEKFTDLRTFISIPMSGFHAASIFLRVIRKTIQGRWTKRPHHIITTPGTGSSWSDAKEKEYNNGTCTMLKQFQGRNLRYLKGSCAITTNTVITMVPWRVQNQKLSGHLEVQKRSKRLFQDNRKRAAANF